MSPKKPTYTGEPTAAVEAFISGRPISGDTDDKTGSAMVKRTYFVRRDQARGLRRVALRRSNEQTRASEAEFVREAIDDWLKKYDALIAKEEQG